MNGSFGNTQRAWELVGGVRVRDADPAEEGGVAPQRRIGIEEIGDAALRAFTAAGYRLTQMADVAATLDIAMGTLYREVAGKDALFELALRRALNLPIAASRPLEGSSPSALALLVESELTRRARWPELTRARRGRKLTPASVEAVLGELYDQCARDRGIIRLLDRCAVELPTLAEPFARVLKARYIAELTRWIEHGTAGGPAWAAATARAAMEAVVWMALHRPGDILPPAIDEATGRGAVVALIGRGLAGGGGDGAP